MEAHPVRALAPHLDATSIAGWFILADLRSPTGKATKIFVGKGFSESPLSQQLAIVAAGLSLAVGLAIVLLAAISSAHTQEQLHKQHGSALAQLLAHRVSTAMGNSDLLSISATLQRFVSVSAAEEALVTDLEGKVLGQAGGAIGRDRQRYSAVVRIESDVAGEVTVVLSADEANAARTQLALSLLGLALLLSLAVYAGSRHFAQRLGQRLQSMARRINLEEEPAPPPANELSALEARIDALPMDLLRARGQPGDTAEHYRNTGVLYLYLPSLAKYVDSFDEHTLQSYTRRLHEVIYTAAGFYGGDIQVARQFGLAVYFCGDTNAGSTTFRAASCGWLIRAVCSELQQQMSLSLNLAIAVSGSELGMGDSNDIYPGLYMQHTLDELHDICLEGRDGILLAPALSEDVDIVSRLRVKAADLNGYGVIEEFAPNYRDLLDRQRRLIMRRLQEFPGRHA